MTVLHLGVIDVPYVHNGGVTTGDVAGWLENKYHIMEIYSEQHDNDIARNLEDGLAGALESLLMGAPPSVDPFGAGLSKIEEGMKDFISNREMDSLGYPGVPTRAAILRAQGKRRSSRKRRRRASNAQAVSFYDTGLYQTNMKAWID